MHHTRVQPQTGCIWAGVTGAGHPGWGHLPARPDGVRKCCCAKIAEALYGTGGGHSLLNLRLQPAVMATVAQAHSSGAAAAARWHRVASSVGKTQSMGVHQLVLQLVWRFPSPVVDAGLELTRCCHSTSNDCPCCANIAHVSVHVRNRVCLFRGGAPFAGVVQHK